MARFRLSHLVSLLSSSFGIAFTDPRLLLCLSSALASSLTPFVPSWFLALWILTCFVPACCWVGLEAFGADPFLRDFGGPFGGVELPISFWGVPVLGLGVAESGVLAGDFWVEDDEPIIIQSIESHNYIPTHVYNAQCSIHTWIRYLRPMFIESVNNEIPRSRDGHDNN